MKKKSKILAISFQLLVALIILFLTNLAGADTNLVAHWKMENNWNDSSGNENNGTGHGGAGFTNGIVGQCGSFDGSDDYVEIGDVDLGNQLTLSAWIYPKDTDDRGYIIGKIDGSGTGGYALYLFLDLNQIAYVQDGVSNLLSNAVFTDVDTWVHVAITIDGEGTVTFYKNGVSAGTGTRTPSNNDDTLRLGTRPGSTPGNTTQHFNGLIDEVKIYNRALSEEEIKEEMGFIDSTKSSFDEGDYVDDTIWEDGYVGLAHP